MTLPDATRRRSFCRVHGVGSACGKNLLINPVVKDRRGSRRSSHALRVADRAAFHGIGLPKDYCGTGSDSVYLRDPQPQGPCSARRGSKMPTAMTYSEQSPRGDRGGVLSGRRTQPRRIRPGYSARTPSTSGSRAATPSSPGRRPVLRTSTSGLLPPSRASELDGQEPGSPESDSTG